jgi:hypothetical protein
MLQPIRRRLRFALNVRGVLRAVALVGKPFKEDILYDIGINYNIKKVKGQRAWHIKELAM